MSKGFSVILAATDDGGIGKNSGLPWKINRSDMKRFKDITRGVIPNPPNDTTNAVIMGRNTWQFLPPKQKPLSKRINVVITSDTQRQEEIKAIYPTVLCFVSFEASLEHLLVDQDIGDIFVIGGKRLYEEALKSPLCNRLYLTKIKHDCECDTFVDTDLLPPNGFVLKSCVETEECDFYELEGPRMQGGLIMKIDETEN